MRLKQNFRAEKVCLVFCVILLSALLYHLHGVFLDMSYGRIISDIPAHVELALEKKDYGLSSFIIRALFALGDESFALNALSMVLSINVLAGVLTLWLFIYRMLPDIGRTYAFTASILAHFCGTWIIPVFQPEMYLYAYNGIVFHNMTMLFSRTFIPLVLLFFFDCWGQRHGQIRMAAWFGLALSMLICTAFKPSFAFAFIPMLGVLLIYDFVRHRAKWLKNNILLGLAVVPAGLVCIAQYLVLFSQNFSGGDTGIVLKIMTLRQLLSTSAIYFRGGLFNWFILLCCCIKKVVKGKEKENFLLLHFCNAIAIFQAAFLAETGMRAEHGNMTWGALSIYTSVFAFSIGLLFRMIHNAKPGNRADIKMIFFAAILLLGHLIVGTYCLLRPGCADYLWWKF